MSSSTGWALITGASSGIGRELALCFARDRIPVVLVARRAPRLEDLAEEIRSEAGGEAVVEPADLSDPKEPARLFERMHSTGREVQYLVNNAGFGTNGPFHELDRERELAQLQVNVVAVADLCRLFLPAMVARGQGRILNMASTAGFQGGPFMSTYYATKAFVITFSEGLAGELHKTDIRVTAYCPGATASEFAGIAGNADSPLFKNRRVPSAQVVAAHAYRAMHKGRPLAVHGAMNRFLAWSSRFGPRRAATAVARSLNRKPSPSGDD